MPESAAEDARLRVDERRLLVAELRDVITHQLSNISLQVMSHLASADVGQLQTVLRTVARSSDAALTELRLLSRVLRHDPDTAATSGELAALSRDVAPTAVGAAWARRLTDAGFDPAFEVPAVADRLGTTAQRTLVRVVDVTCANVLHHAPSRSRCTLAVRVTPTQVVIRTASPLEQAVSGDDRLDRGLRGLRARIHLTGGEFSAGCSTAETDSTWRGPSWVVVVVLPQD